ncbi:MAG: DUF1552 domain-containing protein [Opitutae bacterium]|jgi:hypothetical protein|nr:DUF1552 domain-containing protein [Opitutae bacterium]MBT6462026.1 DUF1552 domain-containing protein [Opitutae bacterium]MBT7853352.1 DUF1552 domain-containing protein [Opitutae bacterium]
MKNLSRRKFLVGNGALLTLPFLSSLAKANKIAGPARKFVLMYLPNGLVRRCFIPGEGDDKSPGFKTVKGSEKFRGNNDSIPPGSYPLQLTPTMKPLSGHLGNITLLTGLDRPYKLGGDAHAQGASCYLSSVSPEEASVKKLRFLQGRTLDHMVGEKLGRGMPLKTLEISCNGFAKPKESIRFDNISWYGVDQLAPSVKDPQALYDRLFLSDDVRYNEHLNEVTSLVLADAKFLSLKLGRNDRDTLDAFMTMIRDIEIRISRLRELVSQAGITRPTDEVLPRGEYIKLQCDLMIAALQMGITNVTTMMIGPERWNASMLYEGVFDKPVVHHSMSHNQKGEGYAKLQKLDLFHMEKYAYVLSRMKDVKEADGSSLLDNSIVACGVGLGDGATHQYFDLPLILAGKAQAHSKHGRHLQCRNGTPISNAWLTIAQQLGLEMDRFANSTGTIPELFS